MGSPGLENVSDMSRPTPREEARRKGVSGGVESEKRGGGFSGFTEMTSAVHALDAWDGAEV